MAVLGAAYTVGSTLWLFRYGPRMLHFCASMPSLGKSVHRIIQADALPDYFAFQAVASLLMVFGQLAASRTSPSKVRWQLATWIVIGVAVASALANSFVLGPMTVRIVQAWPDGAPSAAFSKQFGITHGTSMLLNLFNLIASLTYIVLVA